MTGVSTLVADRHAHVKDAQGIDEAGSEAQDVLDQLKGEIVTSIVCGYVMLYLLSMGEISLKNRNKNKSTGQG